MFDDDDDGICELCDRETVLTFHHLVPKEMHSTILKRKMSLADLGLSSYDGDAPSSCNGAPAGGMKEFLGQHGAWLCRPCHSAVHRFADNTRLGLQFNTMVRDVSIKCSNKLPFISVANGFFPGEADG